MARATTGKPTMVYANSSFHGLTAWSLSLMSDGFWREGFGPLRLDTVGMPFGDIAALEKALARGRCAAFIVEPVQAQAGIRVPSKAYVQAAEELCHARGAFWALDEVQTGLYRTETFLAAHPFEVRWLVSARELDKFVAAIRGVVELADTSLAFWTEALNRAKRAINI